MSNEVYDRYFETVYQQANSLTQEQFDAASRSFAAAYRSFLPENKDAAFLDIGCGAGHFLYFLQKSGYRNYTGIDISSQQVDVCRQKVSGRVEVSDALSFLEGKEGAYDFIAAHDVLEHLSKDKGIALVRKIHASLKEGGVFVARVPNMSNPLAGHARYIDLTHELGFTERSFYQLFALGGFHRIDIMGGMYLSRRSWRSLLRRLFLAVFYAWVRFLYYVQDYSVPRILDRNMIAVCRKETSK